MPNLFISYSHDSAEHKDWVVKLASTLRSAGVDVSIDQWDLRLGQDLGRFMEQALASSDRVLVVCSESYVKKANAGRGGVGYEKMIITAEVMQDQNTLKFIPVIRNNSSTTKTPHFLGSRLYVDFSNDEDHSDRIQQLLHELHDIPLRQKPSLGTNPFRTDDVSSTPCEPNAEKVKIFGITEKGLLGKTIGGCVIREYIDSGGFGFVYRAEHKALGHDVAIKISYPLPPDLPFQILHRFEARILEQKLLSHSCIARVFGSGRAKVEGTPRLYVTSEFIKGATLRNYVGPFVSPDHAIQVTRVYRQLCEAVAHAHNVTSHPDFTFGHSSSGLVHGDIKPGNVLVTPELQTKLVDFDQLNFAWFRFTDEDHGGLADQDGWLWVTAGSDANVFGTPGYMAPELISGNDLSVQSDIFALGITLYELCTGEKLPIIRTQSLAFGTLTADRVELLLALGGPFVPNWACRTIVKAVQDDPRERAESVGDLLVDIPAQE